MPGSVNIIRNPAFSEGKAGPRRWVFSATSDGARWRRGRAGTAGLASGMTVTCDDAGGSAFWSQVAVCKPGKYYRVEAVVTCDLVAVDDTAGVILTAEPTREDRPAGDRRVTPALHRTSESITLRATYHARDLIRRVKISIGIENAQGTACIHEVRLIEILEPDEESHILAIPPPPFTVTAPSVVKDVCVCSASGAQRSITRLLAGYFGDRHVSSLAPRKLHRAALQADALLLPDPTPPPAVRSINGLLKLAADRIVVISLEAFANVGGGLLSVRRIEQEDDPIFAKVVYANFATRGFALQDTFAYAWAGRTPGSFVQRQYRKTSELRAFCKQRGFETLLVSMCDQDATSDRPICLFKPTPGGSLFVLDIDPAEAAGTTFAEPVLAMHLLLSILGQTQTSIGQFVAPLREQAEFRSTVREMEQRFEHFAVHDPDVPAEEVTEQLITIGREHKPYAPPLKPKPVILVRSGLTSGDVASVYGAFIWFKQFVRGQPHACPYARELASQFRLAWVPCLARWEAPDGWCRGSARNGEGMEGDEEANLFRRPGLFSPEGKELSAESCTPAEVAAMIDIVSCPINRVRVVVPGLKGSYQRYLTWLPRLADVFSLPRYFAPCPPEDAGFSDRTRFAWRAQSLAVHVVADEASFNSDAHRDVMAAGGDVVRIEVPGSDADFTAFSIQRTDLTATLLEHVIGLQFGLIAVNRQAGPAQLDGFPPVATGKALTVDRRDPMLQADASRAG